MILHFIPNSLFSYDYIFQINNYFPKKHFFIIYKNENDESFSQYEFENVYLISGKIDKDKLKKLMENASSVVLHSLLLRIDLLYFFLKYKKKQKKYTLIFWGADLYDWSEQLNTKNYLVKSKYAIRERMRKKLFKKIDLFCFLTPNDKAFFLKLYNMNIKTNYAIYSSEYVDGTLFSYLSELNKKKNSNDSLTIMIGHSGSSKLNHQKIIQELKPYKDYLNFYIPLSYGNIQYINQISKFSQEELKESVKIEKNILSLKEYCKKVNLCDILIINSNRQIGIGNISIAILLDKIICLNVDSPNYLFFKKHFKLDILTYDDLINILETKNFDMLNKINFEKNKKIIRNWLSKENFIDTWKSIFLNEEE